MRVARDDAPNGRSLLACSGVRAGERITDEMMRLRVIRLAFPNAEINATPRRPEKRSEDKTPYAFTTFTSVAFLSADRSSAEKLMMGGDYSFAASGGIGTVIFDVAAATVKTADVDFDAGHLRG